MRELSSLTAVFLCRVVVPAVVGFVLGAGSALSETVTWNGADTGGDQMWTDGDSDSWSGDTYDNGDDAQFLGAGLGTVTVSGAISPASVTVDAGGDYTFVSNVISGGTFTGAASAGGVTINVTASGEEAVFFTLIDWTGVGASGVDLADFNVVYNGEDGSGRLLIGGDKLQLRAGALGMVMIVN